MSEVVLIDPPFPERPWDINWITQFPPKGLLYIASALRDAGIDVSVLDTKIMQYEKPSLLKRSIEEITTLVKNKMRRMQPKIVAITSTTISYLSALEIAKAVKESSPETMVVIGGVHATFTSEDTLKNSCIDVVVRGEGENTMIDLANNMPLKDVKGISYRSQGKIVHNTDRPFLNG
ncbi:MAG: hypothetical protein GQ477_03055, partial [Nanohaloarchaea archaeon]|nr:hypothetical protein [Candidatus Nanohaloarchaea archaeon]